MKVPKYILLFAGSVILTTALLGFFYSRYWLFVTMFIGINLFQFGITGFCPLAVIVNKIKGDKSNEKCCCFDK